MHHRSKCDTDVARRFATDIFVGRIRRRNRARGERVHENISFSERYLPPVVGKRGFWQKQHRAKKYLNIPTRVCVCVCTQTQGLRGNLPRGHKQNHFPRDSWLVLIRRTACLNPGMKFEKIRVILTEIPIPFPPARTSHVNISEKFNNL